MFQPLWLGLLHKLPPELAHRITLRALQLYGALPSVGGAFNRQGDIACFGLNFAHRLGVAAGLDKDAIGYKGLLRHGFGFVEVGTVTPKPQIGNPLPRLFRLLEDKAVINRMGFNNRGIDALVDRMHQYAGAHQGVLGINIGPNKASIDPAQDYITCFQRALHYADYFTINLSSPNTPGLRKLQHGDEMRQLLKRIHVARLQSADETGLHPPMLIKIAPDWLDEADFYHLLDTGVAEGFDGFIISNTTISRPDGLLSANRSEGGGLSGAPVFALSTAFLAKAYLHVQDTVPLVGAGGIFSFADAVLKLKAGARLLQVYSGLTISPYNINLILKEELREQRENAIFYSDKTQSMIGVEAGNLYTEEKVRLNVLSHNA